MKTRKLKTVTITKTNSFYGIIEGEIYEIKGREYFFNGEFWMKLFTPLGTIIEVPSVFTY